jgi:asparagine synthase (glutamine-hydrolysing)
MLDSIAHRGPDASRIWVEGSAGLAHCALWTTPEASNDRLPLIDNAERLAITADLRIDNRTELLQLLYPEHRAAEISDSALVLAAYKRWRAACPEKLVGDFAFAIWDSSENRLFCARDHFGVKPFYYYLSDTLFAFSSEIKAILRLPGVSRRLNESRVGDHLSGMYEDKKITFYQDILRLPPGQSITVDRSGMRLQAYWSPDAAAELKLNSDQEYADAFGSIFEEAVRCRLRSAVPVGSMLSGGLDSSSIACTAAKLNTSNTPRLPTFSAIFDDVQSCDERTFISAVLAQDRYEPHFFNADRVGPLTSVDGALWVPDEAPNAPNIFVNLGIYEAARSQGVRVILDGFDGDTTVSHGTTYLVELARAGRWISLARQLKGFSRNFEFSFARLMARYVWGFGVKPLSPNTIHALEGKWRSLARRLRRSTNSGPNPGSWRAILNPDFTKRISLAERRKQLRATFATPPQTEKQNHYRTITSGVMPYTLEVLDSAASAFGLELRFPFWDKRLVEFCLSLPPEQKMWRGWTRMILRRAMAGTLPEEVRWRGGKANLAGALSHGLSAFERARLEDVIVKDSTLIEEYVNVAALRRAYSRFISGEVMDGDVVAIWRAVSLALWLRRESLTPLTNGSSFGEERVPSSEAVSSAAGGVDRAWAANH